MVLLSPLCHKLFNTMRTITKIFLALLLCQAGMQAAPSLIKAVKRPVKSALMVAGAYGIATQPEASKYYLAQTIPLCVSIPVWVWGYKEYQAARSAQSYRDVLIHGASGLLCAALGTLLIDQQLGSPVQNALMHALFNKN